MAKPKPPKRLFKNTDRVSSYEHDRSKINLIKHMSRDHLDVLQNIEFVLVEAHRADPKVDDRIVHEALSATLSRKTVDDPDVAELVALLDNMRIIREDVGDDVWRAAIKLVDDSVRRHSDLAPGNTAYLLFVSKYVK
jgi:hypothetical protein